jgi:hypothetical protein
MKALELTIYPPIHRPHYGYGIDPYREQWKRERAIIESKRLTEGELSAEYWRAGWIAESEQSQEADNVARTLYRFATRPHYDDKTTP